MKIVNTIQHYYELKYNYDYHDSIHNREYYHDSIIFTAPQATLIDTRMYVNIP